MNLKNYTSGIPVERTVARIEGIIAEIGAKAIGKNYEKGKLTAITFQLSMEGRDFLIRLPARPDSVYTVFTSQCKRPHSGTLERLREQAERTAWKIQQDWLEVELTNIRLNQKAPLQAFMPYIWDGEQTFFERLKGNGFKALPEKT